MDISTLLYTKCFDDVKQWKRFDLILVANKVTSFKTEADDRAFTRLDTLLEVCDYFRYGFVTLINTWSVHIHCVQVKMMLLNMLMINIRLNHSFILLLTCVIPAIWI